MPSVRWIANSRGEYWIEVNLGGRPLQVLVDSGLIDGKGQVGFSVDESLYDDIKQASGFMSHQKHARLTADGQILLTESGSLDAQLMSAQTQTPVGPVVHVYVYRGVAGFPHRVGVAFIHLLKGCKVFWDLDQREWRVDYP
jgi:DNA-binding GntR family transcriptional regulator